MTEALFPAEPADDGGLGDAARRVIASLRDQDLILPEHELICALLIQLAYRVGVGLQQPRTSIATTNLARLLLDSLDKLPSAIESGGEAWEKFAADMAAIEQRVLGR